MKNILYLLILSFPVSLFSQDPTGITATGLGLKGKPRIMISHTFAGYIDNGSLKNQNENNRKDKYIEHKMYQFDKEGRVIEQTFFDVQDIGSFYFIFEYGNKLRRQAIYELPGRKLIQKSTVEWEGDTVQVTKDYDEEGEYNGKTIIEWMDTNMTRTTYYDWEDKLLQTVTQKFDPVNRPVEMININGPMNYKTFYEYDKELGLETSVEYHINEMVSIYDNDYLHFDKYNNWTERISTQRAPGREQIGYRREIYYFED